MKLVTVEDLKVGDILAKDVLLEDFTVLLSKGTVIKEEYINKLRDLSIRYILKIIKNRHRESHYRRLQY